MNDGVHTMKAALQVEISPACRVRPAKNDPEAPISIEFLENIFSATRIELEKKEKAIPSPRLFMINGQHGTRYCHGGETFRSLSASGVQRNAHPPPSPDGCLIMRMVLREKWVP